MSRRNDRDAVAAWHDRAAADARTVIADPATPPHVRAMAEAAERNARQTAADYRTEAEES